MKSIKITAKPKTQSGKKGARAIRANGGIPCVIYGKDRTTEFSTEESEIKKLVYSSDFKIAEVVIEGKAHRSILKEIQFHPVTDQIVHLDFLELVDGHPVKVDIPLKTKGSSPGVKLGGKLIQSVLRVKVKTKPENLVDELFVDVSKLGLGQSLRIKDIHMPEGMEVLQNASIPVIGVEIPRALKSAASAAALTLDLESEEEEVEENASAE